VDRIEPGQVAKWLLLAFAGSVLCFLVWMIWNKEGGLLPRLLFCVLVACWLCAPAAVAALLVASSGRDWISWSYLVAQVAVIGSAVWLLVPLFLIPDAQNGIALMFFPLIQGVGLIIYALMVSLVRWSLR
jgi:hypothetical protein